ncbi:DAP2, Dipeptidyl aminopeptidaseacylaminoacyl-peptidase [Pyrenophora tritici-repentis]|nr:DAP2 Dipeptidyl aminopeptidase acylaminoacyl-peptidase [Pyrenophora tritici-repentis]PZC89618.1 DAP2, Dipeptidyl aminopeptidase acylaminoacyl-peptidase [Pyrenophora tritici-repentis]PZD23496.1 DAP2, Dipeptidyl aminopeptidaseacylaminoacyl-peptidase [Pyrenophora tritici-repentis]
MPRQRAPKEEEAELLTKQERSARSSEDASDTSISSISTTSLVLEHINDPAINGTSRSRRGEKYTDEDDEAQEAFDVEGGRYKSPISVDKKTRRWLWIVGIACVTGWALALVFFLMSGSYKHVSTRPHDPLASSTKGSGKKITMDDVFGGRFYAREQSLKWIAGPNGEDGLLLERDAGNAEYLVVEDIRNKGDGDSSAKKTKLMQKSGFNVNGYFVRPVEVWPSKDFKKVLVQSDFEKNWRHSGTGKYWIFDVATQTGEPLDPENQDGRVQLASLSPQSDAVVFTRNNNMYLRKLDSKEVIQITRDGGSELFYGIPDWVYEEEVFQTNSATWWSEDGKYIAFLRTDESTVPTYPVQYFVSRPSGDKPKAGEENYPEVRNIKYPKAGAPNPIVTLQFYDVEKAEVFSVEIEDDFRDNNRLITEIVWAGKTKQVLVRETNRESDILKVVLMDVEKRTGKTVRTENVAELDGGWFEVSQKTTFVPADPANGRKDDGYIDTIIHEGYDHIGYFTPLDNDKPIVLSQGEWEVVDAPSRVDLKNNIVYYISTAKSSMERHAYSVFLNGTGTSEVVENSGSGYYGASFSAGGSYALITYQGPGIPWQKIISTPSSKDKFEKVLEENKALDRFVREREMPILNYQTIEVDGFKLNVLERRPPHFNEKKKYPVLFYQYSGPGSQEVNKKFHVDFQAYIAANLEYIVVTVDGRGTGFLGRKLRCITRGNIGYYEAHDQIAAAKIWASKKYVDADRLAIWGWSYGGFNTLKTLEQDAGQTFKYGMAVAPVTDWRYYDSIYTERYMHTPQNNAAGYNNSTITDVASLAKNTRFLLMHGVADDNVHMQNTLTLLDRLDLAGVENYDVHVFPDSDHSIYFHNANRIVYDKLRWWLINAFNGEWAKIKTAEPKAQDPRQYVPATGQTWTSLHRSQALQKNNFETDPSNPNIHYITTAPLSPSELPPGLADTSSTRKQLGIGQRAILLQTSGGNVLWDCVAFLNPDTISFINSKGGIKAIVISHPHFYTTHLEWAGVFKCPVYMAGVDQEWLNRADKDGMRKFFGAAGGETQIGE